MQHWSQLATKNWKARPVRTCGAILAIALGTGAVVWVTCSFESVRTTVLDWANQYIGKSHISVESTLGSAGKLSHLLVRDIEKTDGVRHAAPLMSRRLPGLPIKAADAAHPPRLNEWTPKVDFYGIDPAREPYVRDWPITAGQMLAGDDEDACVLEHDLADEHGVGVGDVLLVWRHGGRDPRALRIVGLVERRRIARFQKGLALLPLRTLQAITDEPYLISSIDVVSADDSVEGIRQTQRNVIATIRQRLSGKTATVRSTAGRMQQIKAAQSQQELVLALLSSVAMLTALFIILSTLSMGMIERISQLGLMRCVGVTGRQLAILVGLEVAPLGAIGVIAGVPIGLGMALISVWLAPQYVGGFTVSSAGILLAVIGGLATTLVAAVLPMFAALTVSPLEAAHPRARKPRTVWLWAAFALALALILAQGHVLEFWVMRSPNFVHSASLAIVLLYLAYACAAPLVVWIIGSLAVVLAARVLVVRTRLLQDQVGHAVWRSTGIACGLMVGLSLIVGLMVFSESFKGGWQFPKKFPAAFIWSIDQMRPGPDDCDEVIAGISGIESFTTCNAVNVSVIERPPMLQKYQIGLTWFLGIEPHQFLDLVQATFVEGERSAAETLLERGRHVLVADDFARSRDKHLGDEITVYFANRPFKFKIAAVVTSPALDIAANYFELNSQMQVVASGSVIGTNADMEALFNLTGRRILLANFDLPPEPVPDGWPPAQENWEYLSVRYDEAYYDRNIPIERRWMRFRERDKLHEIAVALGSPYANYGTVAELKDEIDSQLTNVTRLLTMVPSMALIVAALGVANLMTANVTSRAKQLAMLRAIGATRGQILRLVIGEALVLGLIGSALGIGLGLHLAANTTLLTERMWGFSIALHLPWGFLAWSVVLTVGLCVLAGMLPARRAARTNVVEALHVT